MAPSLTATMTSTEGPFIPFPPPSPHDTPNTIPMQHSYSPWQGMSQLGLNQWQDVQKRVRHGRIYDKANHFHKYHQRRKGDRRSALKEETERQIRLQLRSAVSFEGSKSEEPRGERIEDMLQVAKNDLNGATCKATRYISQTAFSPRRRSIRRVIPGLPRPPTFKRVLSERRDKLYPIDTCHSVKNRSVSTDRRLLRYTPCSSNDSSPPRTPTWFSTPEMRLRNPHRSSSQPSATGRLDSRSPTADEFGDTTPSSAMQTFGLLPPPHFDGEGDDPGDRDDRQGDDGEDGYDDEVDPRILREETDTRWILNLSMHFRDRSDREKFFLTYAKEQNQWLRVTVTCDYRDVPEDSLESELKSLHFQRDKSDYIYKVIRDSLTNIDFYDTVTNLRLETRNEQLHVHVTEDVNEIISYPSAELLRHINFPRYEESALQFESHLSGFVYKVRVNGQIWTKKEIPGPGSVDEFLYEVDALSALHGAPNVIQLGGLVVDETGQLIKGLLIRYAEKGSLADLLGDLKGTDDLPWSRRQRWAKEIVAGLSELHESGFVQGDFTLSNIVIDEADHARIIDVNRRGCPMGWEPPEFFPLIRSGQRIGMHIGVKCDLFQLGMVLWALAEEEDEPEKQERPLVFSSETERGIPRYFQHIVRDCLSEHPRGRPSAKDLLLRFSLAVQDDHETARGRSRRPREESGSGDNRGVISQALSSAEVVEQRLPIEFGQATVNQDDVEHLPHPQPRPRSISHLCVDDFPAGAVTYGNITSSTEHSSNLHRQPLSQSGFRALSSSPFAGDQIADTLSLLSSEVGESVEAESSSGENLSADSGRGGDHYVDSSHWQQIYDVEGTRQLINRASLSTAAQDEGSLMSGEIRFVPSIITTTDSSYTAWNTSSVGSLRAAQLASPLAAHKAPTRNPRRQDRAVHDSTNDHAENGDVPSIRENEERFSQQDSLFTVEKEHMSGQDSAREHILSLVSEPSHHPSCTMSSTEYVDQGMRHDDGEKSGQQRGKRCLDEIIRPSGIETGTGGRTITNVSNSNDDVASAEERISVVGASFHERAKQLRQSHVLESHDTPELDRSTSESLNSAVAGRSSAQKNGQERPEQGQKESEQAPWGQVTRLKRRGKDIVRTNDGSSISNGTGIKSFTKAESKSYDDLAMAMNEQSVIETKALVQRAATLPASSRPSKPSPSQNAPTRSSVNPAISWKEAEESHSARKLPFFMHAAMAVEAGNEDHSRVNRASRKISTQPPLPFLPSFSPTSSMDLPSEPQNSVSLTPPPVPSYSASSISQVHASATAAVSPSKPRLAVEDATASTPTEKHFPHNPRIESHRRLHRTSSLPIDIINTRPKSGSARGSGPSSTRRSVVDSINKHTVKRKTTSSILPQNIDDASAQTGFEANVDATFDAWL